MPTFSSAIFHLPVSKAFREEMSKCPLLLILIQYILATCSTEGQSRAASPPRGGGGAVRGWLGGICFLVGPEGKNKSQYSGGTGRRISVDSNKEYLTTDYSEKKSAPPQTLAAGGRH